MKTSGSEPGSAWPVVRVFATTHWTVVLTAADTASPEGAVALDQLCRAYWYPLYAYVRRKGHAPPEAQDLTQEFFSRLLAGAGLADVHPARGKFRSFLLASMNHLLANEYHRARCQKRGGSAATFSLDELVAEDRYHLELADRLIPEKLFERRWAEALLELVLRRVREEWNARDQRQRFDELKVFLVEHRGAAPAAELAVRLGVTVPALRSMVQRLRELYRKTFAEEMARTVAAPGEIEDEVRHLFAVLHD